MPFLITWGAWVGAAWILAAAILTFIATRGLTRGDFATGAAGPVKLVSRAGLLRLFAGAMLGILVLWFVGAPGKHEASKASVTGTPVASSPVAESALVQLGACSPFARASILESLQSNYAYYKPATEESAGRSVALGYLRAGCGGAWWAAGTRPLPRSLLSECDEQFSPEADCDLETSDFTTAMLAGDEARAIAAARSSMATSEGDRDEKWRCVALGLEARASGTLEALRAADSAQCRLVLATMEEPEEVPSLIDLDALDYEQRALALTLLAAASPAEASQRLRKPQIRFWFSPAASLYPVYEPGAAAALRRVAAVSDKNGAMLVLQATMQAGVGLNALATVHLDEADAAFERATALVAQARAALERERDQARATLQDVSISERWIRTVLRLREEQTSSAALSLPALPSATANERDVNVLLSSLAGLERSEMLEHFIRGWRAVIALAQSGDTPSPEFIGAGDFMHEWLTRPEPFASSAPRWALHPDLASSAPDLRLAIETGDGEQIAVALGNDYVSRGALVYAAFSAAAGQRASVLSTHLRYRHSFVMCDGQTRWKRLREELLLAHILHDEAWIAELREQQLPMTAHLDDMLLHVPNALW